MSRFLSLRGARISMLNEYKAQVQDYEKWHDTEAAAALKVQCLFRGYRTRKRISTMDRACRKIQRLHRGRQGRKKAKRLRKEKLAQQRVCVYHYMASKIQRIFKSFFSRKYTHNFQARKAYIKRVVASSNELQIKMADHVSKLVELEEIRLKEERAREFKAVTQSLHHLLSTQTTPGIYSSPYTEPLTAYGTPIEDHLKHAVKDYIHENGIKAVKRSPKKAKISIQASSNYDIVQREERKEIKFKKLKRLTKQDFIAGGIASESRYDKSFTNGTQFVEMYKATMNTKECNDLVKTHRVVDKPFILAVPNGKSFE